MILPDRGYAPVGILDPFWNTKGLITPESGASSVHRLLRCSFSTNALYNDEVFGRKSGNIQLWTCPIEKRKNGGGSPTATVKPLRAEN